MSEPTKSVGVGEVAHLLGISRRHTRRLMAEGRIASIVISRRGDRRVMPHEVERLRSLVAHGGSFYDRDDDA